MIDLSLSDEAKQVKAIPVLSYHKAIGFQEVEAPIFLDIRRMKVVSLSALRTGRLYPAEKIPGTHFRYMDQWKKTNYGEFDETMNYKP